MLEEWHEQTLKRLFTVKYYEDPAEVFKEGEKPKFTKLFSLSKENLYLLKKEERDIYDEFMQAALTRLMKTISIKTLASQVCNEMLAGMRDGGSIWNLTKKVPDYSDRVPVLTNKNIDSWSHEECTQQWREAANKLVDQPFNKA